MRLLGLEIGEREIRVAWGERTFGSVRLTGLERRPFDDPAGVPGVLTDLARSRPDAVLVAFPAHAAVHRVFVLPFRDRRRIARTAPLELIGQLPIDDDGLHVACEPLGAEAGGTAVLAAAVRRAELDAHVALLAAAGLAPARVDLAPIPVWNLLPPSVDDQALVVADGGQSALAVRRAGRLAGLRALGASPVEPDAFAAEVRWSLAALGGVPASIVLAGADADTGLAAALGRATGARIIGIGNDAGAQPGEHFAACAVAAGLVAGAGRRQRIGLDFGGDDRAGDRSLRRVGALAAVALLLAVLDLGLVRQGLARRDAALVSTIAAEASTALPGARLVAPRAQLEAAAAAASRQRMRLGGETSALALLRELTARVPETVHLDLDELGIDADTLSLHGRAESFEAVDALRRALGASPLLGEATADETRATVDGRAVEFRLRAVRRSGASS